MAALDEVQIDQVRQIVRLEALRAAVYSVASEALDQNIRSVRISCSSEDDSLNAEIEWFDADGHAIAGGRL